LQFSLNWQVWNFVFSDDPRSYCALDKNYHFLAKFFQKCLWKSQCYQRKICSMLFAANISLEQEVFVAAIMIALFIFTLLMCTSTRSIEAEKRLCSKTLNSSRKLAFCKICAHVRRGSWTNLDRLVDYVADNVKARVLQKNNIKRPAILPEFLLIFVLYDCHIL